MAIPDAINGSFELFGGFIQMLNCWRLYQDKRVQGVSVLPTIFYIAWGFWNLWFYPSLGQTLSMMGASLLLMVNAVWLIMALDYGRKIERADSSPARSR